MDHSKKIVLLFGMIIAFSNSLYADQLSQQAEQKATEEVERELNLDMKEFPLNGAHKQMIARGFVRDTSVNNGLQASTLARVTDDGLTSIILVHIPYFIPASEGHIMGSISVEVEVNMYLDNNSQVERTATVVNDKTMRILNSF